MSHERHKHHTIAKAKRIVDQVYEVAGLSPNEQIWAEKRIRAPLMQVLSSLEPSEGRTPPELLIPGIVIAQRIISLENRVSNLEGIIKQVVHVPDSTEEMTDPDMDWICSHPEVLALYEGKYIAVQDGVVLGSGNTSEEALKQALERKPESDPIIMLVPHGGLTIE